MLCNRHNIIYICRTIIILYYNSIWSAGKKDSKSTSKAGSGTSSEKTVTPNKKKSKTSSGKDSKASVNEKGIKKSKIKINKKSSKGSQKSKSSQGSKK